MSTITATAIKTSVFTSGASLDQFLIEHLGPHIAQPVVPIVAITSKILSIAEGRFVPKDSISKGDLIRRESDRFICETTYGVTLTIKDGLLIPSAGIDESNSESGHYILYPENPFAAAKAIHQMLCRHFKLTQLGVVITDSHTQPLRKGVTGIALSHWGFRATRSLVGEEDLFGRRLKMTSVNVVDAVASAAVYVMGEAAECQPLAIVLDPSIVFQDSTDPTEIQIPLDEDLYGPLLRGPAQP